MLLSLAALGVLLVGIVMMLEARKRSKLTAVRQAASASRKAGSLVLVMRALPPHYLSASIKERLLRDLESYAATLLRSGHPGFRNEGLTLKADIASLRTIYQGKPAGGAGPVVSKPQVEQARRAAAYLHDYLSRQVQRDPGYCDDGPQMVLDARFCMDRPVADYYLHLARTAMESEDVRRARLAFNRVAEVLKPWSQSVPLASRQMEDCLHRARELAKIKTEPGTRRKEWDQWEQDSDWKKKVNYD